MNISLESPYIPFITIIFDNNLTVKKANYKAFHFFNIENEEPKNKINNLDTILKKCKILVKELEKGKNLIAGGNRNYRFKWTSDNKEIFDCYLINHEGNLLLILNNITRSEEFIEIYKESRNYLESIISNISSGILVLDTELRITSLNKVQEQLFNITGLQINLIDAIGFSLPELIQDKFPGELIKTITTVLNTGKNEEIPELKVQNIIFKVNISPLRDSAGNVKGIIQVMENITKEKELEKKVIDSEKLAIIGSMIVTVNHQINNPLTSILGNVQLILEHSDLLPEKIIQRLKKIEENTFKISEITHKLEKMEKIKEIPYDSFNTKMIDIDE